MVNYIPDLNKFHLAGPPLWWQQQLWDFDSSLVVVPSRQACVYRLAQRRPTTLPIQMVNDFLFKESDTRMLASYALIPVTTIIATATWNPYMFQELTNRAPWRMGGADKVTNQIEEQEATTDTKKQLLLDAQLTERSRDAWKLYQKKTGSRTSVPGLRQAAHP